MGEYNACLLYTSVSAYVGDTETDNNIDVYINLENLEIKSNEWKNEDRKELKGDWKFYINVEKENTIEKIDVKDSVNIDVYKRQG